MAGSHPGKLTLLPSAVASIGHTGLASSACKLLLLNESIDDIRSIPSGGPQYD